MRARFAIAAVCFFWVAAESRFSPSFFWQSVENNFAGAVAVIDSEILGAGGGEQPALAAEKSPRVTLARSDD